MSLISKGIMRATTIKNLLHIYNNSSVENEFNSISEESNGRIEVVPVQTNAIMKTLRPPTSLKFLALGKKGITYNNVSKTNPAINEITAMSK